jgi:hypothetical protein
LQRAGKGFLALAANLQRTGTMTDDWPDHIDAWARATALDSTGFLAGLNNGGAWPLDNPAYHSLSPGGQEAFRKGVAADLDVHRSRSTALHDTERKKRHQTRAPDDKPAHRKADVTWDVGLPVVREYRKTMTLKAALNAADLELGLVGNSDKQPIKSTDETGKHADHSIALDGWYRRALKAEKKAKLTEAPSANP